MKLSSRSSYPDKEALHRDISDSGEVVYTGDTGGTVVTVDIADIDDTGNINDTVCLSICPSVRPSVRPSVW